MVNFIYLAHSHERFLRQSVFSILSYQRFLNNSDLAYRIVVFTDDPAYFEPLDVTTQFVTEADKKDWKGTIGFIHRMKIKVMLEAADKFDGRLFFLDSDNYALRDPSAFLKSWKDDTVIMEKLEYVLEKPADLVGKKYKRFFKKPNAFGTGDYEVTMSQNCWNSGIIGIPEGGKNLLAEILSVCDDMHTKFQKHLSEQMAFSIVLSKHFTIVPFKDFTHHWFGYGQAINQIIDKAIGEYPNGNFDRWIASVENVKERVLDAPLNPDKQRWYKRWFSS